MRTLLAVTLLLARITTAWAQSEAVPNFDESVKASALEGAKTATEQLRDRARVAEDIAKRLDAKPALSEPDRALLETTIGPAVAAQVQQAPKIGAAALRQISSSASEDAKNLEGLTDKLVNEPPSTALTSLQGFAHASSQVTVVENGAGQEKADHPKPAELATKIAILSPGTGGPTAMRFENVALLLFWDDINSVFTPACTGTLAGGGKLITAAHCFCLWEHGDPTQTTARCHSEAQKFQDPTRWRAFFQRAGIYSLSSIEINPDFQLDGTMTKGDVAVATLDTAAPHLPQARVPTVSSLGTPDAAVIVGFGYSYVPAPSKAAASLPGLKLWGNVTLTSCTAPFDSTVNYCWASNSTAPSASICGGDSGGPMFLRQSAAPGAPPPSPIIVGINSAGTGDCSKDSFSGDSRLDSAINANFLQNSLSAPKNPDPFITLYADDLDFLDSHGIWDYPALSLTKPASSVVVTVNGATTSSLVLQVRDLTRKGIPACESMGGWTYNLPGQGACTIQSPSIDSTYSIHVGGMTGKPFQLLVTAYP